MSLESFCKSLGSLKCVGQPSGLSLIALSPHYSRKLSVTTVLKITKLLPDLFTCVVDSKTSSIYSWDSMAALCSVRGTINFSWELRDLHAYGGLLGKCSSSKNCALGLREFKARVSYGFACFASIQTLVSLEQQQ